MINTPIAALTASDLDALVTNKVAEGRHLEFKRDLPGTSEKDKIELCADVPSLANTGGGYLLFGVDDSDSTASAVPGLPGVNIDHEIRRLEQTLGSGIDPPVQGITTRSIPTSAGGDVIAVRVPRSWRAPHLVKHNDSFRVYVRASKGKQLLDAREVRRVFESAGDVVGAIRRWRDDRLAKILADDTPVRLKVGAKMVLHIVPLESIDDPYRFTASEIADRRREFGRLGFGGRGERINLDGYLTSAPPIASGRLVNGEVEGSYGQVFRSGRFEGVRSESVTYGHEDRFIASHGYEKRVLEATAGSIRTLTGLGVSFPIVVMLSFLGSQGVSLLIKHDDEDSDDQPIDRDVVVLPDVVLEEEPTDLPRALRPIFDAVWNACGLPASQNYDEQGNWARGELPGVPMSRVE
ncbi:MAG: ATP-binding protein [Phycisphaeraceae bacterium]|nr:MAG: ATP-binding protein [Phycisphaeraceae bacterium]